MVRTQKSFCEEKAADIDYIEICFGDSKNLQCKKQCQCNQNRQPECVLTSTYPYPPWLPPKEIVKHQIRKDVPYFLKTCVKRNKVKTIKCPKVCCVEPLVEKKSQQIDTAWTRLLRLLAYSCYKRQKARTPKHKFKAFPNCHCSVRMHYQEALRMPVPGWEPRRRFRGVSPPRCH